MTEQNPWRHSLGTDKNPTGGDEPTPRVSFILNSNNFNSFEIFPGIIRLHDISRYPDVGLQTIEQLQSALETTHQPDLPSYAITLFDIGQTLYDKIEAGQSKEKALNTIYSEWNTVLEEQEEI